MATMTDWIFLKFLFIYIIFILFWQCWVFIAVYGLFIVACGLL